MDFFQAQDIARRKTGRLVLLFVLALVSLIVITNLLVIVTLGLASTEAGSGVAFSATDPGLYVVISLAVLAVVGFGSLYKTASLRGGGARVAESLGARLLVPGGGDIYEQRVLNVVEEMAIASSTPVPPVYLMEEEAINAFAAGYSPADAVVGVTRGAITKLQREELQGVIAHEFSHILHGDMRLNIRLIGLLHGILVLGMMGYYLMRTAGVSRRGKNGNGIVFLGLGLIVIGAAGTFFGNLIKAAVSRQREYLADASAVQFTRSAEGIAGALRRIGGDSAGSQLANPGAAEISHALFSQGVSTSFAALFATHPPLQQRIKRLQPQWNGDFSMAPAPDQDGSGSDRASNAAAGVDDRQRSVSMLDVAVVSALQRAGSPDSADLREAHRVRSQLTPVFLQAAHEPHGARALVYFLLLDSATDDASRTGFHAQLAYLKSNADAGVYQELSSLIAQSDRLAGGDHLALINISLSALHQLSSAQYKLFGNNMLAILELSHGCNPMSWLYHYLVRKNLDVVFAAAARNRRARSRRLAECGDACQVTLSLMAHAGQQGTAVPTAFTAACQQLRADLPGLVDTSLRPIDQLNRAGLYVALDELSLLSAPEKKKFLLAVAACIQTDGAVTVAEQALFQTFAEILDCPVPALF
ncbi:MAG: M48 family metallopeptidase [Pseudohongiella sp.]|uniref:M48 family metallopeptidase n=1 Tax=Pseudohongiella sp. TaxID=1979412 RepID=UPI0034A04DF5